MEFAVETDDFGKILAAVGAPGGPEVDDDILALGKFAEFHRFSVRIVQLEIGCGCAGFQQLLRIEFVKIGDNLRLHAYKRHHKNPKQGQF